MLHLKNSLSNLYSYNDEVKFSLINHTLDMPLVLKSIFSISYVPLKKLP